MLVLNSNDIYNAFQPPDIIKAIEEAYILQSSRQYLMPDRLHLKVQDGIQLVMPSAAQEIFCTKVVTVNQKNASRNLPIINGSVQLVKQNDGQLLSIMNGSTLTAIRTGAVGAVAAKYLADKNFRTVGLVGAGVQGLHALWLISSIQQFDQFCLFNYRKEQSEKFTKDLENKIPGIKIKLIDDKEELLKKCQVIVTATTSPTPVLPEKPELLAGKLYICLGSFKPVTGELPRTIYPLVKNIFVDADYARNESGDVSWPLQKKLLYDEDIIQLSQVIIGKHNVRDKTRIFKSVGMALFDLTVSQAIYKAAVQKDIGTNVLL
jgi:ornithine cyclodeaminase